MRPVALLGGLVLAAAAAVSPAAQQPPVAPPAAGPAGGRAGNALLDQAAVTRGRQVFTTTCAACHGADGRGGAQVGTDLSRSTVATAPDGGQQLAALLKTGRPERGMPAFSIGAHDVIYCTPTLSRAGAPVSSRDC